MKRLVTSLLVGANLGSVVLQLICGLSASINPANFSPLIVPFGLTYPIYLGVNLAFLLLWLIFNPKFIWISALGIILGFSSVRNYCPINLPNPHPKGCIQVMSYNVKTFSADQTKKNNNYNEILEYLSHSDADIICFQEYAFNDDKQGKGIKKVLARWPYADSTKFKLNGVGIRSRYPIINKEKIPFKGISHGSMAYTLKVGDDSIIVINNHFVSNSISDDDKTMYKNLVEKPQDMSVKSDVSYLSGKVGKAGIARAEQADSVAAYIQRHADRPIILCGDFNDSPISYVHHRLTKHLKDAYVSSGNGPGISYHESGMLFRLDNILCSEHWESFSAFVDSKIKASDHYPVIVYLRLKGN